MKALVTGITGRIGANLAAELCRGGHHVRGLVWDRDRRVEKLAGLDVELVDGNLQVAEDVERSVAGCDVVFHLGGAFQGGGPFSDQEYFDINVGGTLSLLTAVRATGAQVVLASTDALYDKYRHGGMPDPIDETHPPAPNGMYALSKLLAEQLCLGFHRMYGLPTTILRFAYVLGAGEILDFPQFWLSKLKDRDAAADVLWNGEERLVALRDPTGLVYKKHVADVRDIVAGCLCAAGNETSYGEVTQLAGPRPFTWDEAVHHLSRRLDVPVVELTSDAVPTHYEYDLRKANDLLGFSPRYDVARMIDDAVSHRRGENSEVLPT